MKKISIPITVFLIAFFMSGLAMSQSPLENLGEIKSGVRSKRVSSYDRTGGNNDRKEHIMPGDTYVLCDISGPGVINHIWITMSPGAPSLNRSDVIIRMYWDGNDYPSVESPIGPFFGQGWNNNYNYASLPLAVGPNGGQALVSYFSMPFAKGAKIEIENQTDKEIDAFYYYVDYVELDEPKQNLGYFHAWFNREVTDAPAEGENEWNALSKNTGTNPKGEKNYVILDIAGKGHYVGVNYFINAPTPLWYGEGDDMIFIDGAEMPTIHGTGTEDYFNTSWCPNEIYNHPYYGYALVPDKIGWLGKTHVYRFHIEDPVYFDKSIRFTIEHGHNNYLTLSLASVAYWYMDKPAKLPAIPSKEERKFMSEINFMDMHKWRHQWRESMPGDNPWGNEGLPEK